MKPGIHTITMPEYLALKALSSGLCNTLLQYSPYHAKFEQDRRDSDDTEASDIGTAIHAVLLEGKNAIVQIDAPDWRTKAAKEARDAARAQGGIPMLAHKVAQVETAVKAAKEFVAGSEIAGVFDTGKPEQTMIWTEDGVLCKARPDWLLAPDEPAMLHVKTTQGSAEPDSWIRNQLTPMGYDVAAMFYERGGAALSGSPGSSVFLVIEQSPPHGCSLVALSPAMMDLASRKVERAIRIWQECKRSGVYPCYPSRIAYAEPKAWELAAEEERDVSGAYDQLQDKEGLQA